MAFVRISHIHAKYNPWRCVCMRYIKRYQDLYKVITLRRFSEFWTMICMNRGLKIRNMFEDILKQIPVGYILLQPTKYTRLEIYSLYGGLSVTARCQAHRVHNMFMNYAFKNALVKWCYFGELGFPHGKSSACWQLQAPCLAQRISSWEHGAGSSMVIKFTSNQGCRYVSPAI